MGLKGLRETAFQFHYEKGVLNNRNMVGFSVTYTPAIEKFWEEYKNQVHSHFDIDWNRRGDERPERFAGPSLSIQCAEEFEHWLTTEEGRRMSPKTSRAHEAQAEFNSAYEGLKARWKE